MLGNRRELGCKDWNRSCVRARRQAICQRKAWTLRGQGGTKWLGDGTEAKRGEDKEERKEETDKHPFEEGNQRMVSGFEGIR